MSTAPPLFTADFQFISKMVRDKAGIVLNEDKQYLIESRLKPLIERHKLGTMTELCSRLRRGDWGPLHYEVVDAMTTNETFFFRDLAPFDALRQKVLPEMIDRRSAQKSLSIWCAASSTGQEPWSILISLREHFPILTNWQIKIVATDISTSCLARAKAGRYTQQEVDRGMPAPLLNRYFQRDQADWVIRDQYRNQIEYKPLNLVESWFNIGLHDIVFCRNVLIYFDVDTKRTIFGKIRKVLAPDGYLFLGGAETPLNIDDKIVRVPFDRGGLYRQLRTDEKPPTSPHSDRYPVISDSQAAKIQTPRPL